MMNKYRVEVCYFVTRTWIAEAADGASAEEYAWDHWEEGVEEDCDYPKPEMEVTPWEEEE